MQAKLDLVWGRTGMIRGWSGWLIMPGKVGVVKAPGATYGPVNPLASMGPPTFNHDRMEPGGESFGRLPMLSSPRSPCPEGTLPVDQHCSHMEIEIVKDHLTEKLD